MSGSESHNNKQLQREQDEHEQLIGVLKAVAVAAGIGLGAYFLGSLFSSGNGSRKTMKAPGRDMNIFRDTFEANPSEYFSDLRK